MSRSDSRTCRKHGFDLADAAHFEFDTALIEDDHDAEGEQPFRAIGFVGDRLCFFVFAERGDDVRAISLRAASAKEGRRYHENDD